MALFICYQLFHYNNVCESVSLEFIMLNMLVRRNKHGIVHNTTLVIPSPIQPIVIVE